jgi:hypothetical protein
MIRSPTISSRPFPRPARLARPSIASNSSNEPATNRHLPMIDGSSIGPVYQIHRGSNEQESSWEAEVANAASFPSNNVYSGNGFIGVLLGRIISYSP